MTHSPWHEEYLRQPADPIFGRRASDLAILVSRLLPPRARVLELGCGEGRDCLFFAGLGFWTAGIEVSAAGLAKARRLARERDLHVRWIQGDVADLPVRGAFELIYSCGAIHYVPRPRRPAFFSALRRLSPPAGVQAHVVFTDRIVYREKGEVIDYYTEGELRDFFPGWLVRQRAESTIGCGQDGRPHEHSVEQIVLEAPAGDPAIRREPTVPRVHDER